MVLVLLLSVPMGLLYECQKVLDICIQIYIYVTSIKIKSTLRWLYILVWDGQTNRI
jgi:hypothetical protein